MREGRGAVACSAELSKIGSQPPPLMRSSGHESFVCRYPWLPKAHAQLRNDAGFFSDETNAMVVLGLGKNMLRSMRFWVQAFGLASATDRSGRKLEPTSVANKLLDREEGWDPFLEDVQTLWLLHWNLATNLNPLLAWDELLFRWSGREIVRSSVVAHLQERSTELKIRATKRTLEQHFDIFLNTYFSSKIEDSSHVLEDSLDSPLVELRLVVAAGLKPRTKGAAEQIYRLRHEPKPEITPALFMHCLSDFWDMKHADEQTLSLQQVASAHHSPGTVFRLPESDIRERLELIEKQSRGYYTYHESVNLQQLRRSGGAPPDFLASVYDEAAANA